jgi:hypothetical protein
MNSNLNFVVRHIETGYLSRLTLDLLIMNVLSHAPPSALLTTCDRKWVSSMGLVVNYINLYDHKHFRPRPWASDDGGHSRICRVEPALLRGDLKRLPSEIMREIMLNLDIQSLNTWRRVSSFFLYFVDNLREYSLFKENAWHTLSVMHFCDLGSMFPIRRLFAEFCRPDCAGCGAFGPLLFLPSLSRCCRKCLIITNSAFRAVEYSEFARFRGHEPGHVRPMVESREPPPTGVWLNRRPVVRVRPSR